MPTPETLRIVANVRRSLAGDALTSRQAKLYSQRLRRDMGRPGLATFSPADVDECLDDAMWLIDCALIERAAEPHSQWRKGVKRAAEILEFLSQHDLRPARTPMHLLAAAAYQVAGFPAMALAQLGRIPAGEPVSDLLREFLRADFSATLEAVRTYWGSQQTTTNPEEATNLPALVEQHFVMCLGTLCMYFKTGDRGDVDRAVAKLGTLAKGYLHSQDSFSYLLATLTALAGDQFVQQSLWNGIRPLADARDDDSRAALEQFARSAFVNRRALIWPAQATGVARLGESTSFVLCTPTGSGKTTVATLAVVQGLFSVPERPAGLENLEPDNLILYVVPSRALAAEVEKRLSEDLRGIAATPVVVTGLYGGIDWGPTDAWIQKDTPTIVICTFEKADALLRYLGVLFLHRTRLVVIDEAHMVEQSVGRLDDLRTGSSRELRLELLGTRLIDAQEYYDFRIIALSAVAAGAAPALARWIGGTRDAEPTTSAHRSTRQMLGRIEVSAGGRFNIRYNLMDGRSLRFEEGHGAEAPFVPTPFPDMPNRPDFNEPEKAMRAPALWAALHLAAERPDGTRPSVLISVTQSVVPFASECADWLEQWPAEQLPAYRSHEPEADALWQRCLASAVDYFGINSVEHRLLQRGVAVHHGKMPGLLARRLKILIDRGYVRVIIATSTLSEGVNMPVSYLLVPSVYRANTRLTLQEFTNLIGRAGRPGVSTEGHALVLLPEQRAMPITQGRRRRSRQRSGYEDLVRDLENTTRQDAMGQLVEAASSPLSQLLSALESSWRQISANPTQEQFLQWLEQTSVTEERDDVPAAVEYLDILDAFLIATIQELEQLRTQEIPPAEMEQELTRIWQRSYAFAAAHEEERLRRVWIGRGRVIKTRYPDAAVRRQIYRTSLAPRSALTLVASIDAIRNRLVQGAGYAALNADERLTFVGDIIELLSRVPTFHVDAGLGPQRDFREWRDVLRWWLAKDTLTRQPSPKRVTDWYHFVAQNFIYRGAWGLGSILSLLFDNDENGQPIAAIEIDDWPRSGLPWSAFWLKELLTWGTLEPVAAYLLARGNALDRDEADRDAASYYDQLPGDINDNDKLDPRRIREWLNTRDTRVRAPRPAVPFALDVTLTRDANAYLTRNVHVMHFEENGGLNWIDAAGYLVATSPRPREWPPEPHRFHFQLDVDSASVSGSPYLQHQ